MTVRTFLVLSFCLLAFPVGASAKGTEQDDTKALADTARQLERLKKQYKEVLYDVVSFTVSLDHDRGSKSGWKALIDNLHRFDPSPQLSWLFSDVRRHLTAKRAARNLDELAAADRKSAELPRELTALRSLAEKTWPLDIDNSALRHELKLALLAFDSESGKLRKRLIVRLARSSAGAQMGDNLRATLPRVIEGLGGEGKRALPGKGEGKPAPRKAPAEVKGGENSAGRARAASEANPFVGRRKADGELLELMRHLRAYLNEAREIQSGLEGTDPRFDDLIKRLDAIDRRVIPTLTLRALLDRLVGIEEECARITKRVRRAREALIDELLKD